MEPIVGPAGFTGSSCRDASKFIEQALGEKAGEKLTVEFYDTEMAKQEVKQQ